MPEPLVRSATQRVIAALSIAALFLLMFATPARAVGGPVLTITPTTWNVIGLDSNAAATSGPDTFPVGARVCNTGGTAADNVTATFVWDSANSHISLADPSSLTRDTIAAGDCADYYFQAVVERDTASYDTTRGFHITASGDGTNTASTPTPRELYVEHLVSQNRNSVDGLDIAGACTAGTCTVFVGNTYTITLDASTATQGYEQLEAYVNLPGAIFEIESITQTYSTGGSTSTFYADGCGWVNDPADPDYRSCTGTGKNGGTLQTVYTVKVIQAGSGTLASLIYDFSGSSFHYNSDFGLATNALEYVAVEEAADLSVDIAHTGDFTRGEQGTYTIAVDNAGPSDAADPTVTITLPAGVSFVSSSGWTCNAVAQTVTCALGSALPGGDSAPDITLTVDVASDASSPLTATAVVSSSTNDTDASNNTDDDPTTVVDPSGDGGGGGDGGPPPANTDPVATDDATTTDAGTPVEIDVLGNDTDDDGDTLTISTPSTPSHGTVLCTTTCVYTPDDGFSGTDTFTYLACDPSDACDEATVTITVPEPVAPEDPGTPGGPAPSPPNVNDESVIAHGPTHIHVIDNDDDPADETLRLNHATEPAHGDASCSTSGDCLYTPGGGFTGTDSFRYEVCNTDGRCAWGTATIRVMGVRLQKTGTDSLALMRLAVLFMIVGAMIVRCARETNDQTGSNSGA